MKNVLHGIFTARRATCLCQKRVACCAHIYIIIYHVSKPNDGGRLHTRYRHSTYYRDSFLSCLIRHNNKLNVYNNQKTKRVDRVDIFRRKQIRVNRVVSLQTIFQ